MDYTIQKGDTLSGLAKKYGTTVQNLATTNKITDPNKILTGATIKIPGSTLQTSQPLNAPTSMPPSTTIPAQTLGTVNKMDIPQPLPSVIPTPQPNFAEQVLKSQEVEQTDAQRFQETAIGKILQAQTGLQGEAQALAEAQKQAGLEQKKQELNTINSQILQKQAEIAQDDITLIANMRAEERRDTLLPFAQMGQAKLAGDAQIMRALKNSEIGVLNASAIAKQGDIQLAMETAKQAVDLKYAPYKDQIELYTNQLKAIEPLLSRDEKKQAREQEMKGKLAMREIDRVSDFQKTALENAIQNNAPVSVQQGIMNAKNITDILKIGSGYLADAKTSLSMELTRAQIAKTWADAKQSDTQSGILTDKQIKSIDSSPQGKKLTVLSGLYQKSQTYKNLVDLYGFNAVGSKKALIDQAYADLKISYKEAANLGALTGPDVLLLEEAIKPAAGGAAKYLNYKLSGGKEGVSGAIENALTKSRKESLQNYKQLILRQPEYANSEYVKSLISPFAKNYNSIDVSTAEAGEIIETDDGILLESLGNGQFTPL